jgi:hypothetical protein
MKVVNCAVCVLLVCLGHSNAEARDFPLASCKGANGTIIQLSDVDTDHATMVGTVTLSDALEYCVRQVSGRPGSRQKHQQCARDTLRAENGAHYRASANCPKRLLESKIDQRDRIFEVFGLVHERGEYAWSSMRTDKVLRNSCGDGTPPLFEQFKILCPTEAQSIDVP